jgi:solute carrier family 25 folate transporter 32
MATWASAVAGSAAGAATAVAICPLDVIKTRMQVQKHHAEGGPKYKGLFHSASLIAREEGLRGLYKGLSPTLMALIPSWAVYFSTYEMLKSRLCRIHFFETSPHARHLAASIGAGAVNAIVLSPIWVVRTRLQVQETNRYTGVVHCLRTIVREEGFRALYRGLSPSFLGLIHVAVQFPAYEMCKGWLVEWHKKHPKPASELEPGETDVDAMDKLPVLEIVFASAASKLLASVVAYPHEVLRSKMQQSTSGKSIVPLSVHLFRKGGIKAFYRGLSVNLVRVVPAAAITFTTFELTMRLLGAKSSL